MVLYIPGWCRISSINLICLQFSITTFAHYPASPHGQQGASMVNKRCQFILLCFTRVGSRKRWETFPNLFGKGVTTRWAPPKKKVISYKVKYTPLISGWKNPSETPCIFDHLLIGAVFITLFEWPDRLVTVHGPPKVGSVQGPRFFTCEESEKVTLLP